MNRIEWTVCCCFILCCIGCIEQEFSLSDKTPISGSLEPDFAAPLGGGRWSFMEALSAAQTSNNIEVSSTGQVVLAFPFDAFEVNPLPLPSFNETTEAAWEADAVTATALSQLPVGESASTTFLFLWECPLPQMTGVDSLWLGSGTLEVQVTSTVPMQVLISGTCANFLVDGQPLVLETVLESTGNAPEIFDFQIPTEGVTLIGSGVGPIALEWDWAFELTSSGNAVPTGASLQMALQWNDVTLTAGFGKFATGFSHAVESSIALPEWTSWDPAIFYIENPKLQLNIRNSFGITLGFEVGNLLFAGSSGQWSLEGTAVTQFPIIEAASAFGDTAVTQHVIDNGGTEPNFSDALAWAADSLHVSGDVLINPLNTGNQFASISDVVKCDGVLELPLGGWANGITWRDTVEVPISQELQAGVQPPLDWMDVEQVTIRFLMTNGWPLELTGRVYFLGASGEWIMEGPSLELPGGEPATGLPANDPNFGRVMAPVQQVVDYVLTRELALELAELECTALALEWQGRTTAANDQTVVRFFADDFLDLHVAAKVECEIDWVP